jgi:hypothetical protein
LVILDNIPSLFHNPNAALAHIKSTQFLFLDGIGTIGTDHSALVAKFFIH